jgi:hypothetical protein
MKTYVHFIIISGSHQNEKCYGKKIVEKKTNILLSIFSPENLVHYETIWGKYGTARYATADKTIRRKKDATLMQDNYGKAADTHS